MNSAAQDDISTRQQADPERWLEDHGDSLYAYAMSRVRNAQRAEDLVQETLLAAFRNKERFQGRSSERSWLIGILKHKVIDHFRNAGRETSFTDLGFLQGETPERFDENGFWIHELGPQEWRKPSDEVAFSSEFWMTLKECLRKLPQRTADVFLLREVEEVSSEQICDSLGISENNLWVILHRARGALRQCLEANWFCAAGGGAPGAR